jgi:hypothetical protein
VGMLRSGFLQPKIERHRDSTRVTSSFHCLAMMFPVTLLHDRLQGMQHFKFLMQPNRR